MRKGTQASPIAEEAFISKATAETPGRVRGKDKSQAFSLMIPTPLYQRLQDYVEEYEQVEGVRQSMASVIVRALKKELDEAEEKLASRGI